MTNTEAAPSLPISRTGECKSGLTTGAAFILATIMFGGSACAVFFLQSQSLFLATLGFSGLTVPDAISLETSVHLAWTIDWEHIPNIQTFLGTVLVYFPITFLGGTYAAIVNVLMLAAAAALFNSMVQKLVIKGHTTIWLTGVSLVLTNLYVLSCLFFPNKEIPLIFLTTLFAWSLISGTWQIAVCCVVLSYWFRDGYALIMAMAVIVTLARRFAFAPGGVLSIAFLILLFVNFPIADVQTIDTSLRRNVHLGSQIAGDKFSVFGDVGAYVIRLAGNALNLALRPQMVDVDGGVYILGIGYWQFGIVLLGGVVWALKHLVAIDTSKSVVALLVIAVLVGISYGAFVQPRYMMPLIFPLTLGLTASRLGRYIALPAAVIFPFTFSILGLLPPLASG